MSETLYMRISTQNIACLQRQINTCHTSFSYILWAYGEHMSKWSSRTSDQFIWLVSEKKTETESPTASFQALKFSRWRTTSTSERERERERDVLPYILVHLSGEKNQDTTWTDRGRAPAHCRKQKFCYKNIIFEWGWQVHICVFYGAQFIFSWIPRM